jgi:hypothetical protein
MKTLRRTISAAVSLALAVALLVLSQPGPATAAALNDCVNGDNGDPTLTSFSLWPSSVDVTKGGRQVHFSVTVSDLGGPGPASGTRSVRVAFGQHTGFERTPFVTLEKKEVGVWVGSATVRRWSKAGTLAVQDVVIVDRAGNRRFVTGQQLGARGFPHAVSVTSTPDTTPPVLNAFTFTPHAVDTRTSTRRVIFTARVTDVQSHVRWVLVAGLMNGGPIGGGSEFDLIWLTKIAGTAHRFRGHLRVHRWVGNGTWKMYGVVVQDRIGNFRFYGPRKLDALGFRHTLPVTSRTDTGFPHVASFTIRPTPIDIRTHDQQLTVRVHATDSLSGVGRVFVNLEPSLGDDGTLLKVRLHRVSGTGRDGIWVGTATLARCAPVTSHLRGRLNVIDRAGNWGGSTSRFNVEAVDHIAPSTDLGGLDEPTPVKPTGPLPVRFSEAVNGISTTSAPVREQLSKGSHGPAVPGTWTCLTRGGATTNCATGNVRTAKFTPTNGFTLHHWYDIELNPEFSLDITDLAGNPFRRDRGSFYVTN